ncbi:MAG: HAD family hydrolase [Holosporales bacterium]|jgi:D-glycero-D-manno-heptose 1,7-bisphosphate phosphatase|nr:HAD family hydrolase [Holosporales bacterium]
MELKNEGKLRDKSKALFLDRDGVINVDYIDVSKKENFEFINGIFEVCIAAQKLGYKLIVITNQSGVSRGVYTEEDVVNLHCYMKEEFLKHGIIITDIYVCTSWDDSHEDRKPNPGMLLKAREKYSIDMKSSIMLGDKERDVLAGINAGCGKTILFSSDIAETKADIIVNNLSDVIRYL